jgi:hypothetical protein
MLVSDPIGSIFSSCGILKRELEVEGILLSIVAAGLITSSDYILSTNVYWKCRQICAESEVEVAVSGGGDGDGSAWRKSMC